MDQDLEIEGGGLRGAVSKKHFFRPLGLSLVLKVRGGLVPWARPLDPPLTFLAAPILIYFIDSCISALLTLKLFCLLIVNLHFVICYRSKLNAR